MRHQPIGAGELDHGKCAAKLFMTRLHAKAFSQVTEVHSLALRDRADTLSDLAPLLDDKKPAVRFRAAAAYLRLENLGSRQRRHAA